MLHRRAVLVEISIGELIDKITILEIKVKRIGDAGKLAHIREELDVLSASRAMALGDVVDEDLMELTAELTAVNEALWDVEDELRILESNADFGARFVTLARSVYVLNDRRASLKRQINDVTGSRLVEEKSYAASGPSAMSR